MKMTVYSFRYCDVFLLSIGSLNLVYFVDLEDCFWF